MNYDEELVTVLVKAAGNAFSSLKETYKEHFYFYAFIFDEVSELLDKRANSLSIDDLYDVEWGIRIDSMEEAMKRLDQSGLFGVEEERKNIVINVEIAPPDCSEYERAVRLNPESSLLAEYLVWCEKA